MPVNRLPSNPWSGCPSVRGMSAAVMAMRSTFSWASAAVPPASDRAAARASASGARREYESGDKGALLMGFTFSSCRLRDAML